MMSKFLFIPPGHIGVAGIKDKRAVSTQNVTIYNGDINRMK